MNAGQILKTGDGQPSPVKTKKMQNSVKEPLVIGKGNDMQFNPTLWEKWNSDACDKDVWKHGRISNKYRENYGQIKWSRHESNNQSQI